MRLQTDEELDRAHIPRWYWRLPAWAQIPVGVVVIAGTLAFSLLMIVATLCLVPLLIIPGSYRFITACYRLLFNKEYRQYQLRHLRWMRSFLKS